MLLLTLLIFSISGFSTYLEVAAVACLFILALKLGIFIGLKVVRRFRIQGDENSRFTPAGAVVRITMALFFLLIFVGGLIMFVKLKG